MCSGTPTSGTLLFPLSVPPHVIKVIILCSQLSSWLLHPALPLIAALFSLPFVQPSLPADKSLFLFFWPHFPFSGSFTFLRSSCFMFLPHIAMVKFSWNLTQLLFPPMSLYQTEKDLLSSALNDVLLCTVKVYHHSTEGHRSWLTMREPQTWAPWNPVFCHPGALLKTQYFCPILTSARFMGECEVSLCLSRYFSSTKNTFSYGPTHT